VDRGGQLGPRRRRLLIRPASALSPSSIPSRKLVTRREIEPAISFAQRATRRADGGSDHGRVVISHHPRASGTRLRRCPSAAAKISSPAPCTTCGIAAASLNVLGSSCPLRPSAACAIAWPIVSFPWGGGATRRRLLAPDPASPGSVPLEPEPPAPAVGTRLCRQPVVYGCKFRADGRDAAPWRRTSCQVGWVRRCDECCRKDCTGPAILASDHNGRQARFYGI